MRHPGVVGLVAVTGDWSANQGHVSLRRPFSAEQQSDLLSNRVQSARIAGCYRHSGWDGDVVYKDVRDLLYHRLTFVMSLSGNLTAGYLSRQRLYPLIGGTRDRFPVPSDLRAGACEVGSRTLAVALRRSRSPPANEVTFPVGGERNK